MALKKSITFRGIPVPDAYIKVYCPQITPTKDQIGFGVHTYAAADLPLSDVLDAVTMSAPYDLDGPNPLAQAYEHLKTLPEFAGAVDA